MMTSLQLERILVNSDFLCQTRIDLGHNFDDRSIDLNTAYELIRNHYHPQL